MKRLQRWLFYGIVGLLLLFAFTTTVGWIVNVCSSRNTNLIYYREEDAGDAESMVFPLWGGQNDRLYFATDRVSLNLCAFGFPSEMWNPGQYDLLLSELRSLQKDKWSLAHERRWLGFHILCGHWIYYEDPAGIKEICYEYDLGVPVVLAVPIQLFLVRMFFHRARKSVISLRR
jgi:hypothetical protein